MRHVNKNSNREPDDTSLHLLQHIITQYVNSLRNNRKFWEIEERSEKNLSFAGFYLFVTVNVVSFCLFFQEFGL